jgi:ABC-type nickel/cobalt efflux system permease component RcnA
VFAAIAGLSAGLLHVLSGPDHLAAVAPLAADAERTHWKAGLQWGMGHTAGVLLIGLLLVGLRELLPVEAISAWSERAVGLALIGVGVWGLLRARRLEVHRHDVGPSVPHAHVRPVPGGSIAAHGHEHAHQHRHPRLHGHVHTRASFAMGTLHGLAGSSHVFGVLPALALPGRGDALAYLGGFGIGAVLAMTAFAAAVGVLAHRAGQRGRHAFRRMLYACSLGALAVGGYWLVG